MEMNNLNILDFERPVVELERRIAEMRSYAAAEKIDLDDEIAKLEKKAARLREDVYRKLTRWQRVQLARHPDRPYTRDYIEMMFTDWIELHGDRAFADDHAIMAGFATFNGQTICIVGHQKGRDTKQRIFRNFGQARPEGYRKALRVMQLAARFSRPIVTFIDTQGAYPGIGAEERGQAEAIAVNLREMALLPVPVVSLVIGEGGSGGALGIGVADRIYAQENTYYSVITPEGCASILWRSKDQAEKAAEAMKVTSADLNEMGIVDGIVNEPEGGAHRAPDLAARELTIVLRSAFGELGRLGPAELVDQRIDKYARMGVFAE
jgi:acetyl-CoA carboxylase carboxyl transferase subunit alpha